MTDDSAARKPDASALWLDEADIAPAAAEDGGEESTGLLGRLSFRIPAVIVGTALVTSLAVGAASFLNARDSLLALADRELLTVLDARNAALERHLLAVEQDLRTQAGNPLIVEAADAFARAWRAIPGSPTETLQRLYGADEFEPQPDGSAYSAAHRRYHPWLRRFWEERGYDDVLLFDAAGNLVYTVVKAPDYATSATTGRWKDTAAGAVFRAASTAPAGRIAFAGFAPYAPGDNAPAGFVGTPLTDETGALRGVLAFRLPIESMNALLRDRSGLSGGGRSYVVGPDGGIARSRDRLAEPVRRATAEPARRAFAEPVGKALAGRSGITNAVDRNGHPTRLAWQPVAFAGTRLALLTERTMADIVAPVAALRINAIRVTAIAFLMVAALGVLLARALSRPMDRLCGAMRQIADGDRTIALPGTARRDEIGEIARAAALFRDGIVESERREAAQRAAGIRAEAERREIMLTMADGFESSVKAVVEAVAEAAGRMQGAAMAMSATAGQTSRQATAVSAASEQMTVNVQTVASATEELSVSIAEISRQVAHSDTITQDAVEQAREANARIEGLAEAAQRIGEVVSLIGDIAAQTNLLALNATIEAARAGDAGRGFAVVASEVKSLAAQTARATGEIAAQIAAIQAATGDAVRAIKGIGGAIGQVGEVATSVASAVEEQGAATREIAASVQQAAAGTEDVSGNIAEVTRAAGESHAASDRILDAANALARQGDILRSAVDRFLQSVRAA